MNGRFDRNNAKLLTLVMVCIMPGCALGQDDARTRLMDEIERGVRLPRGAQPLDEYARYYAPGPDGTVIGTYIALPPIDLPSDNVSCAEATDDFEFKDVPCEPLPEEPARILPGQRRWVESEMDLPMIDDGGCGIVNVIFDPKARRVERVSCNGVA